MGAGCKVALLGDVTYLFAKDKLFGIQHHVWCVSGTKMKLLLFHLRFLETLQNITGFFSITVTIRPINYAHISFFIHNIYPGHQLTQVICQACARIFSLP